MFTLGTRLSCYSHLVMANRSEIRKLTETFATIEQNGCYFFLHRTRNSRSSASLVAASSLIAIQRRDRVEQQETSTVTARRSLEETVAVAVAAARCFVATSKKRRWRSYAASWRCIRVHMMACYRARASARLSYVHVLQI